MADEGDNQNISYLEQMFISFSGMIEAGECEDEESLRVEYSIKYGKEDWKLLGK